MERITKEDLRQVIYSPTFDFDIFVNFISQYIDIDIPETYQSPTKKDDLIDLCYKALVDKFGLPKEPEPEVEEKEHKPTIKINLNLDKSKEDEEIINESKPVVETKTVAANAPEHVEIANHFTTRKSHIVHLCKTSKYTISQIVQIINDEWGYTQKGKTSRTRVLKTLRELEDLDNIRINEQTGLITWIGG